MFICYISVYGVRIGYNGVTWCIVAGKCLFWRRLNYYCSCCPTKLIFDLHSILFEAKGKVGVIHWSSARPQCSSPWHRPWAHYPGTEIYLRAAQDISSRQSAVITPEVPRRRGPRTRAHLSDGQKHLTFVKFNWIQKEFGTQQNFIPYWINFDAFHVSFQ